MWNILGPRQSTRETPIQRDLIEQREEQLLRQTDLIQDSSDRRRPRQTGQRAPNLGLAPRDERFREEHLRIALVLLSLNNLPQLPLEHLLLQELRG